MEIIETTEVGGIELVQLFQQNGWPHIVETIELCQISIISMIPMTLFS